MKHIRDPLYGYIRVSDAELRVIGTPAVQRLRCIHQDGLSSAVYPGATHTRFEHSLGVMHLAGKVAESIGLSDAETRAYRIAGLLHDVGHAPFSHATERVMEERLGISHEEQSCRIVDGIANAFGGEFPADPELVKSAILGESQYSLVAGDVDVDRMDYLRRDADETGISHGEIDTETIIRFAEIWDGDIVFSYKSLQAIEALFNARNAMTKSVYEHHTSKIVEAMLQRAVEKYLNETDTDPEVLLRWDDRQLHTELLNHDDIGDELYMVNNTDSGWTVPLADETSDCLYGRIATRNLYKRALTVSVDDCDTALLRTLNRSLDDVHSLEQAIASHAGIDSHNVIVDAPHLSAVKSPDIGILMGDEVQRFSEVSSLPSILPESESRTTYLGVYTPAEYRSTVGEAAETIISSDD